MGVPADQMQRPGMMGQSAPQPGADAGLGPDGAPMGGGDPSQGPVDPAQMDDLDNAQTANRPQSDDEDEATFATMVSGLKDYIFGKGMEPILNRMMDTEPKDLGRVMGEITFALVYEAGTQATKAGKSLDMDMVLGVATDVIDDLTDLLDANGAQATEDDREFALLYAQQLYIEKQKPTEEERNAAKMQLAEQKKDGDVDTAVAYVSKKGTEAGGDPFGVNEMTERPGMMGEEAKE